MKTPNQRRPMGPSKANFGKGGKGQSLPPNPPKHNNPPPKPRRRPRVSDQLVEETLLKMCAEAGLDGSVRPEEVARALLNDQWQTLLHRLKIVASKRALAGDIVILRKGEVADPEEFKGLIKLRITPQGQAAVAELETAATEAPAES